MNINALNKAFNLLNSSSTGGKTEIFNSIAELTSDTGISNEKIIETIENTVAELESKKYLGAEIEVSLNRRTGNITIAREYNVVKTPIDFSKEISLEDAKKINPKAKIGETVKEDLPRLRSNRTSLKYLIESISKNLKKILQEGEYEEFKDRENEIINGIVKKSTATYCIVGIGSKVEAIIQKEGLIPGERFKEGDKINACIKKVERSDDRFQITLSRTSDEFLKRIMKEEISEINEDIVKIINVARDPGSRAKVAIWSSDYKVDPIGACIGMKGSRIKNISSQIRNEKIDIIPWDRNFDNFVKNTFKPINVLKIEHELSSEHRGQIKITVPNESLSLAIGKKGQNIRLASKLLDTNIKVISEQQQREESIKKLKFIKNRLIKQLDIDDILAQFLISEGFMTAQQISESQIKQLEDLKGLNLEIAEAIHQRSVEYLGEIDKEFNAIISSDNYDPDLNEIHAHLDRGDFIELYSRGFNNLQSIAELSMDELMESIEGEVLSDSEASKVITIARQIVYNI